METHDLIDLESIFTEEEDWNTIKELPPDRSPGPDGFVAAFYQKAWQIIKNDVMAMMLKLYVEDGRGFGKLNKAHIVLISKKSDAEVVGDFRPISLTHSAAKLFAKMLANRARRRMKEIVTANQSTFICGGHLHDNFLLVRQVARKIHTRKEAGVFLKLDISRAFDSIAWPFLFEVMRTKGFGRKLMALVAILLRTASTKLVVNGVPGKRFVLAQGLRQGDPASPSCTSSLWMHSLASWPRQLKWECYDRSPGSSLIKVYLYMRMMWPFLSSLTRWIFGLSLWPSKPSATRRV